MYTDEDYDVMISLFLAEELLELYRKMETLPPQDLS